MAIPLLLGNHLAVNGIMGQELIMGSQGIHLPVFKDKDTVGILNGANALGADEFGGVGQITAKSLLDGRIGIIVQGSCGIIQNQNLGFAQESPGNTEPLTLPLG
ncbi:hypothetical protein [Eubacterium aggregans]|uniref:hypothetical protein n=1 Tax=Eubacterium aggregans TaxID=81409 RepID=UPI003F3BEEFE